MYCMFTDSLIQHLSLFLATLVSSCCAHIDSQIITPPALALATHSNKHSGLLRNSLLRGGWLARIVLWWAPGPEKTTSWNYLSAPSYSAFIVPASCSTLPSSLAALAGCVGLLAAAPPLATSLSAPSCSVFIVLGSEPGAAELAAALSAAAWASVSLLLFPNSGLPNTNLHRFWQHFIKCEAIHKIHCAWKRLLWSQDV